ncbi:MAG: aminotransferase class V-fold PLP-dependent enzyme [Chloroflexota bacterium]
MRDLFLLDPDIHFLNHGSFGATPRPVMDAYQGWQMRLERQPVRFIVDELPGHLQAARAALGRYLQVAADDLVYVPNATFGVNVVARSLALQPGDEILASDHEYGACDNAWALVCRQTGAVYKQQPIPLPLTTPEAVVEQFWQGVTARTKVIFLSHITSPTALTLPIAAICARARAAGILTLIDGAHAPGQIDLDLTAVAPDFYTGNCHKWMMAPKGSAFLYARPERQELLQPLVVSWGYGENWGFSFGSRYLDYLQWWGTKDPSAALAVPAALEFMAAHDWAGVRTRCHHLAQQTLRQVSALTGLSPLYAEDFYAQMVAMPLPEWVETAVLKQRLYDQYQIEIPVLQWQEHKLIRLSVQGYNTEADMERLMAALADLIREP